MLVTGKIDSPFVTYSMYVINSAKDVHTRC